MLDIYQVWIGYIVIVCRLANAYDNLNFACIRAKYVEAGEGGLKLVKFAEVLHCYMNNLLTFSNFTIYSTT